MDPPETLSNSHTIMLTRVILNRVRQVSHGTNTAAGSRSIKRKLDTGVEVNDNEAKKEQRHATNNKRETKYVHRYKRETKYV